MSGKKMNWAVFLDRDGTVNEEVEYLGEPERLALIPGAAEGIRLLNKARIPVILVTNQSAIGRGFFPESRLASIHRELSRQLDEQGAFLDAIHYCPHHPDDGCACRKPNPGMLEQAARELGKNLAASFIVGDTLTDLEAGRRVGCRAVLVLTGHGARERESLKDAGFEPDRISADLLDAVQWILAEADVPV